ncbi:site-specific integrase [Litoricolaceae bacterium]|nr:site-specific integrase [Litorivicinaceae bacterium]
MLFEEFVGSVYLPYVQQRKRSWKIDLSLLTNHLLPAFGRIELDDIDAGGLAQFQTNKLREGYERSSINRMTVLMKFIINSSMRWKHRERDRYWSEDAKELPVLKNRERFLSVEEADRLIAVCRNSGSPIAAHLIILLLLTGARKGELLNAKWDYLDLVSRTILVPVSKSNKARYLYLSPDALGIIRSLRNISGQIHMFSPKNGKRPITNLQRVWEDIRKKAHLADCRLHDLRHSYASFLISGGRSLFEVQRLLGHADAKTTLRYAHLASEQLIEAASTVSEKVGRIHLGPE